MQKKPDSDRDFYGRLETAVVESAEFLKKRAGDIRTVAGTRPDDENPHTNLDLEVDEVLKEKLLSTWGDNPGLCTGARSHALHPVWLSEEKPVPAERMEADFIFIVDPIDGTRNVLAGRPEACVSVALWHRGHGVVWGCVVNPFTDETFTATAGRGATLNGNPIAVSEVEDVKHAVFLVSVHESVKGMLDRVRNLFKARPVGSIAYKMCLVAAGRGDATFTVNPRHDWDIAASMLIVREAGGTVTDSRGLVPEMNSAAVTLDGVAVSNGPLHPAVLQICSLARKELNLE